MRRAYFLKSSWYYMYFCMLPLLLPIHNTPLTTFEIEWLAGVCILPWFLSFLFKKFPRIPIVQSIFMPLGILLIVLLQTLSDEHLNATQADANFTVSMYMLCLIMCLRIGQWLGSVDMSKFLRHMCRLWIILGVLTSITLWVQFFALESAFHQVVLNLAHRLHLPEPGIYIISLASSKDVYRAFGNLNQPNQTATVMAIACFSLYILLWRAWQIRPKMRPSLLFGALLLGYLLCAWALPASRTLYLQVAAWGLAVAAYSYKTQQRGAFYAYVWSMIALAFGMFLLQELALHFHLSAQTLFSRVDDSGHAHGHLRQNLWQHGWQMFLHSPLLGVSYGGFAWQEFLQIDRIPHTELANSAHNIVIDTLAKFGMAGFLVVAIPLLMYMRHAWRNFKHAVYGRGYLYGVGTLMLFLCHALVEYPQNYLFFLTLIFLIIGASDAHVSPTVQRYFAHSYVLHRSRMMFLWLAGLAMATLTMNDYLRLQNQTLNAPKPQFFLSSYYNYQKAFYLTSIPKDKALCTRRLPIFEQASAVLPQSTIMKNYINYLICAGQIEKAKTYMHQMQFYEGVDYTTWRQGILL